MKSYFLVIYFCVVANLAFAQHLVYYHLTEKDGLPDIEFYDIVEDKDGFIWLAADKGLYRYDGKTFKNYTHPQKKGLSVFNLQFDDKDRLWCNNISGQFFYVENDSLKFFTDVNNENRGQLLNYTFNKNHIYISGYKVALEVNLSKKTRHSIREDSRYYKSIFSHNDSIFCVLESNIYRKTDNFKRPIDALVYDSIKFYGLPDVKIKSLGETNAILLQITDNIKEKHNHFFLRENYKTRKLSPQEFDLDTYIDDAYTEGNIVWLGTPKGLYQYQYIQGNFIRLNHYFKNNHITSVIKDKDDNYWLTTLKNGVFVIPNINLKQFQNTSGFNISALEKIDEKSFMFGTSKGKLFTQNITTGQLTPIKQQSHKDVTLIASFNTELQIVSHEDVGYVIEKGNIKELKGWDHKFNTGKDISFIDRDNFVYGAFNNSLYVNLKDKTSKPIGHKRSYTTHYNDNTNAIYIGYVDGLEYYNKDFKPHQITFNNTPIFALDITNTQDDIVWVSTFSDGIIGIENGKVIKNYTTANGLLSNQTKIVKGDGQFLWIVSDKGIQRLNTQTEAFENIGKKEGLASLNISDIAVFNTLVVLATNKGIYQLNKEKSFKQSTLSNFYFTEILVEDQPIAIEDSYTLASDVNKIQFKFHTNGFLADESVTYRYRLLDASETWNLVPEGTNQVVFNSLSSGNYTFELQKVSKYSSEVSSIQTVKITIRKPFYKRWWFIMCVIAMICLMLLAYIKRRDTIIANNQKALLEKERLQKQMVASKLKSLQSQLNPHFVFNSMNSIQNLVLKNDTKAAYTYLSKFAALMRDNLQMSEKSFVYFEEELAHIKKYLELEKLRFIDNFNYQIVINGTIPNHKIPSTIIQPFLENAVKHGLLHKKEGDKILKVTFFQEHNTLQCVIEDNGVGMARAKAIHSLNNTPSFSTKAIKEKLELLKRYYNTDIGFYYETVAVGTKVVLKIPFIYAS